MENEDAAEAWLVDYRQKATEAGESIKSNHGEDSTYLSFLASGGQIYIFDGAGLGSILYDDMGLSKPAGMPEQTNISLPVVTYEGLASIDADFIFAVGTPDDLAALTENPVWNSLEAVKNNNVVELPASPYFIQGYSSIGRALFLNEVEGLIDGISN
jgi:iron complex transport system substrate-binding protein